MGPAFSLTGLAMAFSLAHHLRPTCFPLPERQLPTQSQPNYNIPFSWFSLTLLLSQLHFYLSNTAIALFYLPYYRGYPRGIRSDLDKDQTHILMLQKKKKKKQKPKSGAL